MRGVTTTIYLLGLVSGLLVAMIWREIGPSSRDLAQYRAVRDFARETFVREVDDEELLDHALHGMLAELDPYSRYLPPSDPAPQDTPDTATFGIGIEVEDASEGPVIRSITAGGPADMVGLRVGDV